MALAAACAGSDDDASPTTVGAPPSPTRVGSTAPGTFEVGPDDRPARLVPPGDDVTGPAPLLVLLHGYTSTADRMSSQFSATEVAALRGIYVLLPEGSREADGDQFWDAHPACCNFTGIPVDDVGYLRALIRGAIEDHPIDPDRVYLVGYSNGGFMAYRLACEMAGEVAAIAVLAGSDRRNDDDCVPSDPVSVLHLHGTEDQLILYASGDGTAAYPGAVEVTARWARRGGCDPQPVDRGRVDLEQIVPGAETVVTAYEGCVEGVDVQLDTMEGVGHQPAFHPDKVGDEVLDWLLAHSR